MSHEEREEYYRQRAIEIQKGIVNFKSSSTMTSESFIWTYRTTSVDVISVITTTAPITNGSMKDILLKNREIKRLKPAKKSNKIDLSSSPFDISLSVDKDSKRKRMNGLLLSEKETFMNKLNHSRQMRTNLETQSATKIQSTFRGHFVRNNWEEVRHYAEVHKQVRSNIRSYLANKYNISISMSKYKRSLSNTRNKSAVAIQCAYFRYLSRKCLRRRRYELWLRRRRAAAVRIQAMVRGVSSRARVKLLVERLRIVLFNRSATTIQAATRRHMARRRVHRRRYKLYCLASHMIQNWYRARYTRKMAAHIKSMLQFRRNFNGARAMQCLIRKFLAKRRVDRIRLRRLHKLVFRHATAIQCMIRKFLGKITVQRKRLHVSATKEAAEARIAQKLAEESAAKEAAETLQLLQSVDLFLQANKGNTTAVEDIFTGLASTDEHDKSEVEPGTGDSLLTIAARLGNMDLVRKCLLWGFDMNLRNDIGLNALMVAAKHNHLPVMQYLLAPPLSASTEGEESTVVPLDPISEEDAGYLMVTAAANAVLDDNLDMLVKVLSLGLDINAKSATTGMTAVHAACDVGHVEAFKLLVKNKAELSVEDDLGQTPLHKACCNSFKITELILGLDPSFSTYMSDATRQASIMKLDADGKDCILHAALNGQTDTLDMLSGIMQDVLLRNGSQKFPAGAVGGPEEIGWSPHDITRALKLVETGNLTCVKRVADIGFDLSWLDEESGRTMAIAACQSGDVDMIDLIMSYGTDFSLADVSGRTPFHYAADCTAADTLLSHLLMHASAAKCNVSDACLVKVDNKGENVFHIAARKGIELKIDLLAQRVLSEALETKNRAGMTPLLLSCSIYRLDMVKAYMKLGADAQVLDDDGHGCLWHLLHVSKSVLDASPTRRPLCSEYVLHPSTSVPNAPGANFTRKEKDEEVGRVNSEVILFTALLRAGCVLYTTPQAEIDAGDSWSPEKLRTELVYQWNEVPSADSQRGLQCGDVLVQEMSITLLKSLLTDGLLRKYDAWRLLLAAIWFDDGSSKVLAALFKAGLIDLLTSDDAESPIRPSSSAGDNLFKLQDQMFCGLTVLGWIIKLGKPKALQYFMRRGYKVTVPVDAAGNPALHFVAMHGSAEMVETILIDKSIRLELVNPSEYTAGMLAVKHKNFFVAKKLFESRADCRRSLAGGYAAWVLAFVRRREKNEVNLQTGRYGDDDSKYFDISPDPFYITWYSL